MLLRLLVLLLDDERGNVVDAFIIEAQLQVDLNKLYSWHFYSAGARCRFSYDVGEEWQPSGQVFAATPSIFFTASPQFEHLSQHLERRYGFVRPAHLSAEKVVLYTAAALSAAP